AEPCRHYHRLGARRDPQLAEDRVDVELDRPFADAQPLRNAAVGEAFGEELQDFALAGGERLDRRLVSGRAGKKRVVQRVVEHDESARQRGEGGREARGVGVTEEDAAGAGGEGFARALVAGREDEDGCGEAVEIGYALAVAGAEVEDDDVGTGGVENAGDAVARRGLGDHGQARLSREQRAEPAARERIVGNEEDAEDQPPFFRPPVGATARRIRITGRNSSKRRMDRMRSRCAGARARNRPPTSTERRAPSRLGSPTQRTSSARATDDRVPRRLPDSVISRRLPTWTGGSRGPASSSRQPVRLTLLTEARRERARPRASTRSTVGSRASRRGLRVSRRSSPIASASRPRCEAASKP